MIWHWTATLTGWRRRQNGIQRFEAIDLSEGALALHDLRAALIQIPSVAPPELHVARILEFLDDGENVAGRKLSGAGHLDNQRMRRRPPQLP